MSTPYYAIHVTLLGESNLDPVTPKSTLQIATPLVFNHTDPITSKETILATETFTFHGSEEEVIKRTLDSVITVVSGMIANVSGDDQIEVKNRLKAKYLTRAIEAAAV